MNTPSGSRILESDQVGGLNQNLNQRQAISAAPAFNMPTTTRFPKPIPKLTGCLELGAQIRGPTKAIQPPTTANTFPKFNLLALELRTMIWKLSLPGARVVDIVYDKDQDKYLSFRAKIPSHLHTSREARDFAREVYELSFPTRSNPAAIWMRFDIDTVYFTNWLAGSHSREWFEHPNLGPLGKKKGYGRRDMKAIQRVAVNSVYLDVPGTINGNDRMGYFLRSISPVLERFLSLEKLYVVIEDINPYKGGEITLVDIPEDCHLHKPGFCLVCGASEIVRECKDFKRRNSCRWKVPAVNVVAAARDSHVSHMGSYQKCACNGIDLPVFRIPQEAFRNHPCEAYRPNEDDKVEDSLPEAKWGISENEVEDLIADMVEYDGFIPKFRREHAIDREESGFIPYFCCPQAP